MLPIGTTLRCDLHCPQSSLRTKPKLPSVGFAGCCALAWPPSFPRFSFHSPTLEYLQINHFQVNFISGSTSGKPNLQQALSKPLVFRLFVIGFVESRYLFTEFPSPHMHVHYRNVFLFAFDMFLSLKFFCIYSVLTQDPFIVSQVCC